MLDKNWNAQYETERFSNFESLHESGTLVNLFSEKYRRSMAKLNSRLETLMTKSKQRSAACWLKLSKNENRNGGEYQRYRTEKVRMTKSQFTRGRD